MADMSTQVGAAASTPIVQEELGQDVQFPEEAQGLSDLMKNSKSPRREKVKQMREIYNFMKAFVADFDKLMEDTIEDYNNNELELPRKELSEKIKEMEMNREAAERTLNVNEDKMLENHPGIANNLFNHNKLSKSFLKIAKEAHKQGKIQNWIDENEKIEDLDGFKLGFFLGLEPLFVVAVLWADKKGDKDFLNDYQRLFDRFSFLFTRKFRDVFESETNFDQLELSDNKVKEIVNAKSERQITS